MTAEMIAAVPVPNSNPNAPTLRELGNAMWLVAAFGAVVYIAVGVGITIGYSERCSGSIKTIMQALNLTEVQCVAHRAY